MCTKVRREGRAGERGAMQNMYVLIFLMPYNIMAILHY